MTTKMELFLLILFITVTLLVLTAFDRIFALPFLHSSKREVRDLLVALEDLLLPMGSFPSKLLQPWASVVENYRSNTPALPLSPKITPTEDGSTPNVTPTSNESTPREGISKPTPTPPLNGPTHVDRRSDTVTLPPPIETVRDDGSDSEDYPNEIFFDSLECQQTSNDNSHIDEPDVGVSPPGCETTRFQRALEDQAHEWKDMRGVFDRIINGQNAKLRSTQEENGDLREVNEKLISERDASTAKRSRMKDRFNNELRILNAAKAAAEEAAERAEAGVEGRIDQLKKRYNKEKSDAEQKNAREKNTIICSKRMVEDGLTHARFQATVSQKQHDIETRNKDSTIHQLNAAVRQLRLAVTVSEKSAASAEESLQKQLNDQCKAKDEEIVNLKVQLRDSEGKIETLGKWKDKAQVAAQVAATNHKRLSDCLQDELTTLRGEKQHIVEGLKLDKSGLNRTVEANEVTINRQERRITELESGKRVNSLKRQLEEIKKQLQKQERENEKTKEDKENYRKQLEQATRVPDRGLEEEFQKVEEKRKELSRQLEEEKKKGVEAARKAKEDAIDQARQHEKANIEALKEAAKKESREAQEKATQTESDPRTEVHVSTTQVEKVTESRSVDPADPQIDNDSNELTVLKRESREGYELLSEIGKNGVVEGSIEFTVFQEFISAKNALHKVKDELQKPHVTANKKQLVSTISRAKIDEQYIEQSDSNTQPMLIQQAKAANTRLKNLEKILNTNDGIQKDAMLEAINAPNPFEREVKKARRSKRHTQPEPGVFPSGLSTDVQAGHTMGQSQQTNGNSEQQYDPRLFNLHQNMQPQLPTAASQDHAQGAAQGAAPVHLSGAPYGSAFQNQSTATPQGIANAGTSIAQHSIFTGFQFGRIRLSPPMTMADTFTEAPSILLNNAQNRGSIGQPTDIKTDGQSFSDIMASLNFPASSDTATTAVIPEPVSQNNNASNTGLADSWATNPQTFSFGEQLPLPGLRDDKGTSGVAFAPSSQLPNTKSRGRGRVNASKGRQLAHQAFPPRQSVPTLASTQGQQSDTQQQVVHTQQRGSGGPSQQEPRPDQPEGWTALMTSFVQDQLKRGQTNTARITTLLRRTHDSVSTIEGVEDYVENLKSEYENPVPKMPAGWTESMTTTVRDGLRNGDDMAFTEELVKAELEQQPDDDDETLQNWLKKLESDYKAEMNHEMQQD